MVGNAVRLSSRPASRAAYLASGDLDATSTPHPTTHKAHRPGRANPTTKITVSVRARIQPLRMVRTHHGLAGDAARSSKINAVAAPAREGLSPKSSRKRMPSPGVQCLLLFCAMIEHAVDVHHSSQQRQHQKDC
jgi:hypothetical protein